MKGRALAALQAGTIAAVAAWVYAPALGGGWVWDDLAEVPHNAALRDPLGWLHAWVAPAGPDYFPLKTTVQWLAWRLWGDRPLGYHVLNLVLHVAAALLLWRLLRRLGVRCAFLGGLLFAVHPLAVQSVAWVSELKNTLSLPPLLLALTAYVDYDAGRRRRDYLLALLWFLAAALCKSSVVMLPWVLLLYVGWRHGRIAAADLRRAAPFFGVGAALGLVTMVFQDRRALTTAALALGGPLSRLANAGLAMSFYAEKCLLPVGQVPIYPRWSVNPVSAAQFLPWIGWAALAAWLWRRRTAWSRAVLFGLGCFAVNLLPVLGLVRMAYLRLSWVSDHLAYVSLAAAMGLAAAGLGRWLAWTGGRRARLAAFWTTTAVLVGALSYRSHVYAVVFRTERSLWTYTLARNPACWLAENDLGLDDEQAGRLPEAMAHFRRAVALRPRYPQAEVNVGDVLVQTGHPADALAWYRRAVAERPAYAEAHAYLGFALAACGRPAEAAAEYRTAIALDPQDGQAHRFLGRTLLEAGQTGPAMAEFETALRLDPADAEAQYDLGNALGNAGRLDEAMSRYREAIRLRPGYVEAMANLGLALAESKRTAEAIAELQAALRLRPGAPEAEEYLGFALSRAGRWTEAIAAYERALPADGLNPDLHYNLAEALRAAGRTAEAEAEYAAAARLSSGR